MDIPSLIAELTAARRALEAPLNELAVLRGLPLKPETASAVIGIQTFYQRRERLILRALASLRDLAADGYPNLPKASVERIVYEDIVRNLRLAQRALAIFEPSDEPAVQVVISSGEPELKPAEAEVGFLR